MLADIENTEDRATGCRELDGELVAELLDQGEYPSNIDNVAAISSREICFVRRARHKLIPFNIEYLNVCDCQAIEYLKDTAYYRIVAGIACFLMALIVAFNLATDPAGLSVDSGPLIIAIIALATFGIRFITSTHRHIMHFEMPDETLVWRSPAIDFKSKAEAAHAVCDFARQRGILKSPTASTSTLP